MNRRQIIGGAAAMGFLQSFTERHATAKTVNGIAISDERQEVPEFKRIYTKQLDSRAKITVEMKTYWKGHRGKHAELKQPNGNAVWFDPDRIAERILDPILVPLVQQCVREIYSIDAQYMASNPDEFFDKAGTHWKRI